MGVKETVVIPLASQKLENGLTGSVEHEYLSVSLSNDRTSYVGLLNSYRKLKRGAEKTGVLSHLSPCDHNCGRNALEISGSSRACHTQRGVGEVNVRVEKSLSRESREKRCWRSDEIG